MSKMPTLSRRHFIGYAGASFAFAGGLADGAAADTRFGGTRASMASAVKDIMTATQVPSVAYALVGRDGVIWAESVGVLDRLTGTPPAPDTLYCIGSCSKVFGVAAAMKLAEQGRIDIDKPFVTYVPAFRMLSEEAAAITVRMLMSHSSGVPGCEYRGLETIRWFGGYPQAAMTTLASARLKHRPGEMSVYCNDGFTLLEPLVAAVSGVPFPDFVRRELLLPLGMANSHYGDVPIPAGGFSHAYAGDRQLPLAFLNAAASGGLYTNPGEWGGFLAMFLNEGRLGEVRVLAPETVRQMAENQAPRETFRPLPVEGFGLGWDRVNPAEYNLLGIKAWRKNGGMSTHTSDMIVAPDAGLAVVVSAAAGGFDIGNLSDRLMLEALAEQGTLAKVPPRLASVITEPAQTPIDPAWLDGVFANYQKVVKFEADASGTLTQYQAENGVWKKGLTNLRPRRDGFLGSDDRPEAAFRLIDYEGFTFLTAKALGGYKAHAVEIVDAQKLRPQGPLSSAWQARAGRRWLIVNQPETTFLPGVTGPVIQLNEVTGLEGYIVLLFGPEGAAMNQVIDPKGNDTMARMCLKIPFNGGRDLNDIVIEMRDDGEWLHYGSWRARPIETVPMIGAGSHSVTIGPEGFAEWRKLATLSGLGIAGANSWGLHATDLRALTNGTGDASALGAEDAGYVIVYGEPGSTVTLTLG